MTFTEQLQLLGALAGWGSLMLCIIIGAELVKFQRAIKDAKEARRDLLKTCADVTEWLAHLEKHGRIPHKEGQYE